MTEATMTNEAKGRATPRRLMTAADLPFDPTAPETIDNPGPAYS